MKLEDIIFVTDKLDASDVPAQGLVVPYVTGQAYRRHGESCP